MRSRTPAADFYDLAPKEFCIPAYLMDFFDDIVPVEGTGRKDGYFAQAFELKSMLLKTGISEAHLAGVHYNQGVTYIKNILSDSPQHFRDHIIEMQILKNLHDEEGEAIISSIIPSVTHGLLTDYVMRYYHLYDSRFLEAAKSIGIEVSLDDKKLFQQMVKMKKAMG